MRVQMDTTDPQITFDTVGHCCHCVEFLDKRAKHSYHGKESDEALDRILENLRSAGRGKKYDCVLGMSGGADSSYLGYIVKERGLRPVAVHMDNGWNSEKAVVNIKNITRKLGIDYESYVLDWEEFKDLQLSFLKASVPEAETPTDIAIPAGCTSRRKAWITQSATGLCAAEMRYTMSRFGYFNRITERLVVVLEVFRRSAKKEIFTRFRHDIIC